MKDQIHLSRTFKLGTGILIGLGLVTFIAGFITDPDRTWANYLLNNYYFLMLALGAAFLAESWERQVPGARMGCAAKPGILSGLNGLHRATGSVVASLLNVHRATHRAHRVDTRAAGFIRETDKMGIREFIFNLG